MTHHGPHLILFACPGMPTPLVQAAYAGAVAPAVIRWIPIQGASAVFVAEAQRCTVDGRCLPGLLARWAPDVREPASVSFVGFSAGCWLGRDGLYRSAADRQALTASVLLDGAHAPYRTNTPGATPEVSQVELRRFLEASLVHDVAVVHSDTRTPPPGHVGRDGRLDGYADTTLVARALVEAGSPATILHRPGSHGPILHTHGPAVLRDWLAPLLRQLPTVAPVVEPSWRDAVEDVAALTIGERICCWLGYQFGLAPREIPGPQAHPLILSYSAGCRRGGTFLGVDADGHHLWRGGALLALPSDEMAWCAAFQSGGLAAVLLPEDVPPHGLRVSVRELVEDARAAGTLRPTGWTPTAGSVAILGRVVAGTLRDPLRGGEGHTRAVLSWDAERYLGLGGNEGDTIAVGWHSRTDPLLRGWIER